MSDQCAAAVPNTSVLVTGDVVVDHHLYAGTRRQPADSGDAFDHVSTAVDSRRTCCAQHVTRIPTVADTPRFSLRVRVLRVPAANPFSSRPSALGPSLPDGESGVW